MTQKPEGIKSDEFLSTVELFAATVVAFGAGLGTFLALPLSTPFALAIAVAVVVLTWAAGSYWGLRWGLISGCLFFAAAVAWLIMTRPFYGDTFLYDDIMFEGDTLTASATGTELKWKQSYVYPTPTHRIRDWADPQRCTEHDRFVCGVSFDTYFESDQGWRLILGHDGALTWPEGVTEQEVARFICDLPAEEWDDYHRKRPYITAIQAARPSLTPALEAECGL